MQAAEWAAWWMLLFLSSCLRVGYEEFESPPPADSDAGAMARDASDLNDAGVLDAGVLDADAPDADPLDANDGSRGDAAISCPSPNACGGCAALSNAVGTSCGECGLGQYACDGSDAVICQGQDARPVVPGGAVLVDDLEDGDRFIRSESGLSGDWHTISDSAGGMLVPPVGSPVEPTPGGAFGSAYSVRVQGSDFSDWGAGLAVSLNAYECAVDVSAYSGFTFAAQGTATDEMLVSVATVATTPVSAGGSCTTAACNDHFNVTLPLSGTWMTYAVPFGSLAQTGWGTEATFLPSEVLYIQFSFGPGVTFDVSVDDLAF
jgi:hypothetical protein